MKTIKLALITATVIGLAGTQTAEGFSLDARDITAAGGAAILAGTAYHAVKMGTQIVHSGFSRHMINMNGNSFISMSLGLGLMLSAGMITSMVADGTNIIQPKYRASFIMNSLYNASFWTGATAVWLCALSRLTQ